MCLLDQLAWKHLGKYFLPENKEENLKLSKKQQELCGISDESLRDHESIYQTRAEELYDHFISNS